MPKTAALTGTPGTGKSAIASILSGNGWTGIELSDLAQGSGAVVGRDEERQTDEVDVDLLEKALTERQPVIEGQQVLLVGHLAHHMPCDDVVVLRYDRSGPFDDGATQLDYLTLDLGESSEGTCRLTVTVYDRVAARTVSLARAFSVVR